TSGRSRKKRGYLESNRASGTAHGGTKNYRLERFLEPPRLRPPDLEALLERLLAPFRADDFRPRDFLPDALRAPPFLRPAFRALLGARVAFFLPAFLPADDREALFAAFFLVSLGRPAEVGVL